MAAVPSSRPAPSRPQRRPPCSKTNGSRITRTPMPPGVVPTTTGSLHVVRSAEPQRRQMVLCSDSSTTPEYTTAGWPRPGANTPDQQPKLSGPPGVGPNATGCSVQVTRSGLLMWPQWMWWWTGPTGLCWKNTCHRPS